MDVDYFIFSAVFPDIGKTAEKEVKIFNQVIGGGGRDVEIGDLLVFEFKRFWAGGNDVHLVTGILGTLGGVDDPGYPFDIGTGEVEDFFH